jgi:predicted TIM-barrel fold metal-dependent hydrolase
MTDGRIDAHAHVIAPRYLEAITPRGGPPPALPPATVAGLEAMMLDYGIESAVVSIGPPGAFGPDQDRINEVARTANEELAEIVSGAADRFAGLAVLPLPDPGAAVAEIGYALDTLGLDGVSLFSNVAGVYLGDPRWEPVLADLDRRGAYVFLHPGVPPVPPPLLSDHPVWLYEFPFETTRALANLIYAGALDRHRNLRLQAAHLAGTAVFLAHRIASLADREPQRAGGAPEGAIAYLERLFYDTGLSNHMLPLATTRELVGLEQIVFGTDWPYAALPAPGDPAPEFSALTDSERAALDRSNALTLVPRWA